MLPYKQKLHVETLSSLWQENENKKREELCGEYFNSLPKNQRMEVLKSSKLSATPTLFRFLTGPLTNEELEIFIKDVENTYVQIQILHVFYKRDQKKRDQKKCEEVFNSLPVDQKKKVLNNSRLSTIPNLFKVSIKSLTDGELETNIKNTNSTGVQVQILHVFYKRDQKKCEEVFNSLPEDQKIEVLKSNKLSDIPTLFKFLAKHLTNKELETFIKSAENINAQIQTLYALYKKDPEKCKEVFNSLPKNQKEKIITSSKSRDLPKLFEFFVGLLTDKELETLIKSAKNIGTQVQILHVLYKRDPKKCKETFYSLSKEQQNNLFDSGLLGYLYNFLYLNSNFHDLLHELTTIYSKYNSEPDILEPDRKKMCGLIENYIKQNAEVTYNGNNILHIIVENFKDTIDSDKAMVRAYEMILTTVVALCPILTEEENQVSKTPLDLIKDYGNLSVQELKNLPKYYYSITRKNPSLNNSSVLRKRSCDAINSGQNIAKNNPSPTKRAKSNEEEISSKLSDVKYVQQTVSKLIQLN